jgi:hypothetical protein
MYFLPVRIIVYAFHKNNSICCPRALVLVFMKVICEESRVENISCLDEELAFETREAGFVEFGRVLCRQKEITLHFYA